jgi:hypothetical protein
MSDASGARRAGRLFAEGVVVLASILIAFALDAAWDNSELARELDQDLQSVASEIEANIEQARFHVALDGRIVAASEALLGALDAVPEGGTAQVMDTVIWWNSMTPTFEPSFGAVDAVVASGRISAIDDRELSRRLASLRSEVDDAVEEEFEAQTYFESVQAPLVFERLDFSDLGYMSEPFAFGDISGGIPSRGAHAYPNTTAIRSAIEYRRYLYLQAISSIENLMVELEEILEMLEAR